jgi:hypothetical protein
MCRQAAIRQLRDGEFAATGRSNEPAEGGDGFRTARAHGCQDQPMNSALWIATLHQHHGAGAADLDVVAVRADAEDLRLAPGSGVNRQ